MRSLLLLLALGGTAAAEPDREVVANIVGHTYDGKALEQLGQLSDLGHRLTGSANYQKAADLVAAWLREAGATNVHFEKVQLAHGWQRGTARARVNGRTIHAESVGWGPSATVKGPLAVVHALDPALIDKSVKGKIVYVDWTAEKDDGPQGKQWVAFAHAIEAAKANGALAIVGESKTPNGVLGTGAPSVGGKILGIPMAGIGMEDGKWLMRQKDPVVELEVKNAITGPIEVVNVVGEIKGSSSEWILLGGHLDSWDFATGSQDNGSGVVQVIAAARALAKAGPLVRSVRFALWASEEQGLNGSHAYVAAHEAELASCAAVLNTDNGAGHVMGWKVEGRKEIQATLEPIAKQLLAPLGAGKVDMTLTADTDHFSFAAAGVPALDLLVDMSGYMAIHHKIGDTVDKVDAHDLASGSAVLAVTAYAIASTKDPVAPHLDHAAVVELFKEGGFDELLRSEGWWK